MQKNNSDKNSNKLFNLKATKIAEKARNRKLVKEKIDKILQEKEKENLKNIKKRKAISLEIKRR